MKMSLRQEIHTYIDDIPEYMLVALKALLFTLAQEPIALETDLTIEERELIAQGMAEYAANPSSFTSLDAI